MSLDKRIMQELTTRDPDNAGWRRELSYLGHFNVGGILEAQGKLRGVLAQYQGIGNANPGSCVRLARSSAMEGGFGRHAAAARFQYVEAGP